MASVVRDILSPVTKRFERLTSRDDKEPKVALIQGVTGIVGKALLDLLVNPSTPGYPWKIYGVARRPRPNWLQVHAVEARTGASVSEAPDARKAGSSSFHYIQLDLLDREKTLETLGKLGDVSHFFWMTWAMAGEKEEENIKVNGAMYKNALDAVVKEDGKLQHIVLQTGEKYYTGPFEAAGNVPLPDLPFREDEPRRPAPNFYHTEVDLTLEAVRRTHDKVTWSEHRPSYIFGFAPRNLMNIVSTLVVYAVICKHDKMPFIFPGNRFSWEHLFDASDASLIAEQELWAALDPRAKNQAFNINNGDVFCWKRMWRVLGKRFDLAVPEYKEEYESSFQELMKGKGSTWDAIVKEHKLEPSRLEDVAQWWFADFASHMKFENVMSMNKSRKFGFFGWRDSEDSMNACLDEMKKHNMIPRMCKSARLNI